MQHLIAYFSSLAQVTQSPLTPVPDTQWAIQNGAFLPQKDCFALAAFAGGTLLDRARIVTPSLRKYSPPYIRPVQITAEPDAYTQLADYRRYPLRLSGLEEINVQADTNAAGPADVYAGLFISDGMIQPVSPADIFTLRGVATTTLVAANWTLLSVTWDDVLPAGNYAACGIEVVSATGIFARLIFENSVWRPGGLSSQALTATNRQQTTKGGLGVLGQFTGNRMPNIEVLASAADTAEEVYLDFYRVG